MFITRWRSERQDAHNKQRFEKQLQALPLCSICREALYVLSQFCRPAVLFHWPHLCSAPADNHTYLIKPPPLTWLAQYKGCCSPCTYCWIVLNCSVCKTLRRAPCNDFMSPNLPESRLFPQSSVSRREFCFRLPGFSPPGSLLCGEPALTQQCEFLWLNLWLPVEQRLPIFLFFSVAAVVSACMLRGFSTTAYFLYIQLVSAATCLKVITNCPRVSFFHVFAP